MIPNEKISYWEQKTFFNDVDYIIIGAGIVGYSTALTLRNLLPEAKILILERGNLPSGASSKNAGFACFGSATELYTDLQINSEDEVWNTVKKRWDGLQNLRFLIGDENLKFEKLGSWDLITEKEIELYTSTVELIPLFNAKIKEFSGEENVYSIDEKIGNINTLAISVFIWILVCIAAYIVQSPTQFYVLASFVGLVMGGVQALARSTYSKLLPDTEDHASYFSFYDVTEKIGIVVGTFTFGFLEATLGSIRYSVISIAAFFIIGLILLFLVPKIKQPAEINTAV